MKFIIILLLFTVQAHPSYTQNMEIRSKFCNLETCEQCKNELRRQGGRRRTARICRIVQFNCVTISPITGRVSVCHNPI